MLGVLGSLIGAGTSIIGGLLGRDSAKDAQEAQRQNALRQEALQREFAQNSIQWKVADAKAAGLHPLAALGASSTSYAPVTVGSVVDNSLGTGFARAGQDISRAMNATRTGPQRELAFSKTVNDLTVQKMGLENELLSSQIAKLKASINPPMPSLGPVPVGKVDPADQMYLGGKRWEHDPSVSNADTFQSRYGEMSDWTMGPYVLWRDYNYNYRNQPSMHSVARSRFGEPPAWLKRLTGEPDNFSERFSGRR